MESFMSSLRKSSLSNMDQVSFFLEFLRDLNLFTCMATVQNQTQHIALPQRYFFFTDYLLVPFRLQVSIENSIFHYYSSFK